MKWTLLALACVFVVATGAHAQDQLNLPVPEMGPTTAPQAPPDRNYGQLVGKPQYNPETKSYFELFRVTTSDVASLRQDLPDIGWEEARKLAESRIYKGTRGRLAIVKTPETNDFIVKNKLGPPSGTNGAWIGLRLLCNGRTLQWVTGEFWPLSAYSNWHRIWNSGTTGPSPGLRMDCNNMPYLPVHYWGADGGYKWNANGIAKRFYYLIIEFPTGKP